MIFRQNVPTIWEVSKFDIFKNLNFRWTSNFPMINNYKPLPTTIPTTVGNSIIILVVTNRQYQSYITNHHCFSQWKSQEKIDLLLVVPKIFVSEGDHCAWWQLLSQLCGSRRLLWKLPGGQLGQRSIWENPSDPWVRDQGFGKWPLQSGKSDVFPKNHGSSDKSALLFWKCWKDQWKEGGWPSKLVVKINQKCEVDHPNCSWNQKNADFQASGANYQTWSAHYKKIGLF